MRAWLINDPLKEEPGQQHHKTRKQDSVEQIWSCLYLLCPGPLHGAGRHLKQDKRMAGHAEAYAQIG